MFREWVCLDHPGYAGGKAQSWYAMHVEKLKGGVTVNDALGDMFLAQKIHESTKTITVKKQNKYMEIIGYNNKPSDA